MKVLTVKRSNNDVLRGHFHLLSPESGMFYLGFLCSMTEPFDPPLSEITLLIKPYPHLL